MWGRSLCINASTHEGAMFDYIARAQAAGWAVLVAGVHGGRSPTAHMQRLWQEVMAPAAFSALLVVGHSAGAAWTMQMLDSFPEAAGRLKALALTDGAFG